LKFLEAFGPLRFSFCKKANSNKYENVCMDEREGIEDILV